jgi:hypothetical protein
LRLAKHAIEHPIKPRKNPYVREGNHISMGLVRHFAVFRAIVAGRLDVVRWFVEDVGVNMEEIGWDTSEEEQLTPLILAVDSGNTEMVRLLTEQLSVEFLGEEYTGCDFEFHKRADRQGRLEQWRKTLGLGKCFTTSYHDVRQRNVDAAFRIAKGLVT